MPKPITEPEKELRFTRAGQAVTFCGVGAVMVCVSLALGLLAWPVFVPREEPLVAPAWLGLLPLPFAAVFFWMAARLARHAYLLLTPVGLEIFPFWNAAKNFRLVLWQEIDHLTVDVSRRWLEVVLKGGGRVFVSLAPVARAQRELLARAVEGAMRRRELSAKETRDT